jgi:DNA-binding SARP family transcriptional activator
VEFRLLGSLEAVSNGQALPLGGPKQRAVLAVLLLNANEVVSVDRLIDDVWGSTPPKSVHSHIQNCISRLRQSLGREAIETRAPGYLLRADDEAIDARRFERAVEAVEELDTAARAAALREALALWRGSPLADLAFETFAQPEISRLDELRLVALERRLEAELELGRHDAILAELDALARRHPARERLRYLQMLALYRAGRQRDALRVYQEARLELVEEYGLEPSESLRALERMIIAHDPSLEPAAAPVEDEARLRRNAVVLMLELLLDDRDVTAAALAEIALIVERRGGSIERLEASEIVAAFAGHDDDAARALRTIADLHGVVPTRAAVARDPETAGALFATAARGDVLIGPEALKLVSGAVDVVPHTGGGFRVLRFDPTADPIVRHFDTPLVGRRGELARLEAAAETTDAGLAVLLGDPGIGKTRLALEFAARTRSFVAVCAAEGERSTLRPVRELLEQVGAVEVVLAGEPDAERVASHLREPAAAEPTELAWALRRLLETLATDEPLVVVFEDVHRAPPTFLDLVDYLVGWTAAPLLVVCVARPELLERRPEWREFALALEPLSREELAQVAPGASAAAIDAAGGNPLFLEQLVAFTGEQGEAPLPPTLEVLIASRVERLPSVERAILERAAVAGREFWRSTVEAVSPEEDASAALMALVRRRLVRPERASLRGEDGFRFQHTLIREAVYAGIADDERAALHERIARAFEARGGGFDEEIGHHLEAAAKVRAELAEEAALHLGAAGVRAMRRLDAHAAIDLLTRALELRDDLELRAALGTSYKFAGEIDPGLRLLEEVVQRSGESEVGLRARIEQLQPQVSRGDLDPDEALAILERARAAFAASGDDHGLGRAWHLTLAIEGVFNLRYREAPIELVRAHYERSGFAGDASLFLRAIMAYRGPTPAPEAIGLIEALVDEAGSPAWESFLLPPLAVVKAMRAQFGDARAHLAEARVRRQEFADPGTLITSWAAMAAEVELLAGDAARAAEILDESCDALREHGGEWYATNSALRGEALYRLGAVEAALDAADTALTAGPIRHLTSAGPAKRVRAKALAQMGRLDEATAVAADAVAILAESNSLDEQAQAHRAAAEVAVLAGADPRPPWSVAAALFESKGNIAPGDGWRPPDGDRLSTSAGTCESAEPASRRHGAPARSRRARS